MKRDERYYDCQHSQPNSRQLTLLQFYRQDRKLPLRPAGGRGMRIYSLGSLSQILFSNSSTGTDMGVIAEIRLSVLCGG